MRKKLCTLFCTALLLLCVLPVTAGANSLPRPYVQLTIAPPDQPVTWIALLTADEPDKRDSGTPAALTAALPDGWYVWDGAADPEQAHRASFFGPDMPETFRAALVLADGTAVVTNTVTRTRSMQTFTVHADSGTITTVPTAAGLLLQFACTCSITLLIEAAVLRLFGFSLRENRKAFLLVNLATQLLMTLTFGRALIDGSDYLAYLLVFVAELVIFIAESIAFSSLLHGQTRRRRVVCTLCANAASFIGGVWLAVPLYSRIAAIM
ncbi:MAG: hypothetical protein ACOYIE_02700 [Agathobaculum sp.]|uniref:hypothetical protein n=1 Tax=Agathobaculum sp. TaxID=2048138 RepID=UPI003D90856B